MEGAKRKISRAVRTTKKAKSACKLSFGVFILVLLTAFAISFYRFSTSDAVQLRFVHMWDYRKDIIDFSRLNALDSFLVAAVI